MSPSKVLTIQRTGIGEANMIDRRKLSVESCLWSYKQTRIHIIEDDLAEHSVFSLSNAVSVPGMCRSVHSSAYIDILIPKLYKNNVKNIVYTFGNIKTTFEVAEGFSIILRPQNGGKMEKESFLPENLCVL